MRFHLFPRAFTWTALLSLLVLTVWTVALAPSGHAAGQAAGWSFVDESKPGAPAPEGGWRQAPALPAGETAGAFTLVSAMQAHTLQNLDPRWQGLRLRDLESLAYCTYLNDAPLPYAAMLQLNVDADVGDGDRTWQGRLVYEPAQNGAVVAGEWQCWDTLDGAWWATGGPLAAFAPAANPRPLAAILARFPQAGLHPDYGGLVLKVGDGWRSFDGYVDGVLLETAERAHLFDFEPVPAERDIDDRPVLSRPAHLPDDHEAADEEKDKDREKKEKAEAKDEEKDKGKDRDKPAKQDRDDKKPKEEKPDHANAYDPDRCKDGGWATRGFPNQGQCVAYYTHLANERERSPRRE